MKIPAFNNLSGQKRIPTRPGFQAKSTSAVVPSSFWDTLGEVALGMPPPPPPPSGASSSINWSCLLSNAPGLIDHVSEIVEGIATAEDIEGGIQAVLAAEGLSDDWDKIKNCFS